MQKLAIKYLCAICKKSVGINFTQCKKWVHKKCSGITGCLAKKTLSDIMYKKNLIAADSLKGVNMADVIEKVQMFDILEMFCILKVEFMKQ